MKNFVYDIINSEKKKHGVHARTENNIILPAKF